MTNAKTKLDRDRYHWYQNTQNPFWKSPIWEVQTRFDEQFNETLLEEIYDIGRDIALGKDDTPKDSIWDYSRPNLDELKHEIIKIVHKEVIKEIPQVRMLNLYGCEHVFGWINVREPGERLEPHGHTECSIAATYYIKAKEGCGDLVLFDSGHAIDWQKNCLSRTPYLLERRFKAVEGRLIFFPVYVLHGVDTNNSDDLRISLSTDIRKVVDRKTPNSMILKSWAGRMAKIKEWQKD